MESSALLYLEQTLSEGELSEQLHQIADKFGEKAAFSLGFGREGMVIADQIFRHQLPIRVFTIDTGRLFQETYELHARVLARYDCSIEVYSPYHEQVELLIREKGPLSFYNSVENRLECCNIRKVQPLGRALKGADVWITAVRSGQSSFRKSFKKVEWNEKHNLFKANPLLNWSAEEVSDYIATHKVPYNALHDKGFPSIGCAPCTRAVKEGEDQRAGRWWWESSQKECGLHLQTVPATT